MNPARELSRIRFRLASLNLVMFALVQIVVLVAAGVTADRSAKRAVEQDLRDASVRVTAVIEHERHERHGVDDEDDDEDDLQREAAEAAHIFVGSEAPVVVFWGSDRAMRRIDGGSPSISLPDQRALAMARSGKEIFSDGRIGEAPALVMTMQLRHGDRETSVLQLAKPIGESRATVLRTFTILGAAGAAGLFLGAVASLFLASRAMRPIERALARQQRFIGDASHELRTPVAVIRARAELLAAELGGVDTPSGAEAKQLGSDAAELAELLSDMLDLARLDAAEEAIELAPTPLLDVAEEVALQLDPIAKEAGIALVARGEPVFAQAHLPHLRQVVRALADNALKYAATRVQLVVEQVGGRARILVEDDGPGIPAEHLPKLMDRFYRVDEARARNARRTDAEATSAKPPRAAGAGLGLAIASELVSRMRGTISIESDSKLGTRASVSLPLARTAQHVESD